MAAGYIYKDGKFDPVGAMDIPEVTNRLDELESANFVRSVNGTTADAEGDVTVNAAPAAGTGISVSGQTVSLATVTTSGGTAGPTANATPAFGATFTVPKVVYDKYGRVTGHTNYTVKIPTGSTTGAYKSVVSVGAIASNSSYTVAANGILTGAMYYQAENKISYVTVGGVSRIQYNTPGSGWGELRVPFAMPVKKGEVVKCSAGTLYFLHLWTY